MSSNQATKKVEELKQQNLKLKSKLDRIQELVNRALVKSPKS